MTVSVTVAGQTEAIAASTALHPGWLPNADGGLHGSARPGSTADRRLFETLSCGDAVAGFFKAAFDDNFTSLKDPSGRCGKLKLGINFGKLHKELGKASRLASLAMEAENLWKHHLAVLSPNEVVLSPNEIWRQLFGRKFPCAKKRFWRAQETEPWVAMPAPEPVATAGPRAWGGPGETGGPVNPRFSGPGGGPTGPDHDPDGPRFWPPGAAAAIDFTQLPGMQDEEDGDG